MTIAPLYDDLLPDDWSMLDISDEILIVSPDLDFSGPEQRLRLEQIVWRRLAYLLKQVGVAVEEFSHPGELWEWVRVVRDLVADDGVIGASVFGVVLPDPVDPAYVVQSAPPPAPGLTPLLVLDLACVARDLRAGLWRYERRVRQDICRDAPPELLKPDDAAP